jgi:hypothetical protein
VCNSAIMIRISGRNMSRLGHIVGGLLAFVTSADAHACPFCESDTGIAVRSTIFAADFVSNLCAVLSPFVLLFGLVGVAYFAWPFRLRTAANRGSAP